MHSILISRMDICEPHWQINAAEIGYVVMNDMTFGLPQ
jgi:hypothetical protein